MQTESEQVRSSPAHDRHGTTTNELVGKVYDELRALAAHYMERERPGHMLPPTAVVHEAYLRLAKQDAVVWSNRGQFLALASRMIRRILVDHARAHLADKRGGGLRVPLDGFELTEPACEHEITHVDEALTALAALDERQARVVELRYFGGLSIDEAAEVLGVSAGTVKGDWRLARAWLATRLC